MSIFSVAPHSPFLPTLADRILDGTLLGGWDRSQAFWLTDVTVILPTQRARLALAEAFRQRGGGFLPDIRTFGGEVEDEEPFLPPFDAPVLPPAASGLERRLVLSRLVGAWAATEQGKQAFSTPPTAGEILSMAESLGELIDDLTTEERTAGDLRAIVDQVESNLGAYWQQTLRFLEIALRFWPEHLDKHGRRDSAALRTMRLDRQAAAAPLLYGDRPVIAAGSTGSIPATARLLAAIQRLPRGALVLPGFDTTMTQADHSALLGDANNPHGHPQYGLSKLLRGLGAGVGDVIEVADRPSPRTDLVRRALAPTPQTAVWFEQRLSPEALASATAGMSILAARTQDEEARAVALAARQALVEGKTVGIVTPDRNLARRIAAELGRWDIRVDDAAGAPLYQSAAGRLVREILALVGGGCAALDLMALLRNRAALFGRPRAEIARLADLLELGLLRGQRSSPGLAGIRSLLAANLDGTTAHPALRLNPENGAALADLLDWVEAALAPLVTLHEMPQTTAAGLASALLAAFVAVADGADIPGRRELEAWANELDGHGERGLPFAPNDLDAVLRALMTGFQVRTLETRRTDIAIWGQLEARLQSPDLLILAALNEDKWPEPADPGPWLSRGMRLAAGLEPPERRHGLAAHDFAQGLGNREVLLAFSERIGTSPAIPSRLVQRLEAFAGEACARQLRASGASWCAQARALDAVPAVVPAMRPAPNPSVDLRPRKLSVTEVETLMRSPYDLYAKHVLGLRPMDALGSPPDARERGTIIHDIFAQFVIDGHDVTAPDAIAVLNDIAREKFAGLDSIAERRDIWLRRFDTAARQFLDWERERNADIRQRHAEIDGEWMLQLKEPIRITGRADRVDERLDGLLEIIDFKTGTPPNKSAMQAFEVPQLLLEAQMARAGALQGVRPADTAALTYVKVGLGPDAFTPKPFVPAEGHDLMSAADELGRRAQAHLEYFLLRQTPMPSRLLPLPGQRFAGPYDHLARVAEWSAMDGTEGEG
ncbi:MAG: addB [Devosia sp.]|nr:addB [Devosia sp.]